MNFISHSLVFTLPNSTLSLIHYTLNINESHNFTYFSFPFPLFYIYFSTSVNKLHITNSWDPGRLEGESTMIYCSTVWSLLIDLSSVQLQEKKFPAQRWSQQTVHDSFVQRKCISSRFIIYVRWVSSYNLAEINLQTVNYNVIVKQKMS